MWLIIAILFVLFFALYPYVARILVRRRTFRALSQSVRHTGGNIRILKKFPSLSGNFSKKPDVWIRCGRAQYLVKVWTPKHPRADLRIRLDGKVRESFRVRAPLSPRKEIRTHAVLGLWRKLSIPTDNGGSRVTQRRVGVLLVDRPYSRMLRQEQTCWRELGGGDCLGERIFLHTPASFVSLLYDRSHDADAAQTEKNREKQKKKLFQI